MPKNSTLHAKVNRGNFGHGGYFRSLSRYAQRKQGLDFFDRYVVAKCCIYMHSTIVLAENVA